MTVVYRTAPATPYLFIISLETLYVLRYEEFQRVVGYEQDGVGPIDNRPSAALSPNKKGKKYMFFFKSSDM